ncbi:MAG: hypothetical protein CFH33_01077 [Alphaproteobacteria bacterium MarineAlpha9_Bin3]|nr:MAG: hypothetical protein CFH33_01077 [Alphaproteobacteria bacterium MarineAlpha9_Bin3]|tara:strand:+ start:2434 stop:2562 length:129 start_codon:yes stop_codon:yes gene_type:complete
MKIFIVILIMIIANLSFAHDNHTLKEEKTHEHENHNDNNIVN